MTDQTGNKTDRRTAAIAELEDYTRRLRQQAEPPAPGIEVTAHYDPEEMDDARETLQEIINMASDAINALDQLLHAAGEGRALDAFGAAARFANAAESTWKKATTVDGARLRISGDTCELADEILNTK